MATVKIFGCSDDLVEVEGDIQEEFYFLDANEEGYRYIQVSDGTVLGVRYDNDGIWRLERFAAGSALLAMDENPDDYTDRYSDVATLTGDIQWVKFTKDNPKRPATVDTPAQQPAAEAAPANDGAGERWESAGAYEYRAGAIQWQNGYAAIKQLAESASGKEHDSRFMHETLDAIHAIAAQEIENAQKAARDADAGNGGA